MDTGLYIKGSPEFKLIIHSHPQFDGGSFSKKNLKILDAIPVKRLA